MNAENSLTDWYHEIIECLVTALEAKDVYTKGHSNRVADMAHELGKWLGLRGTKLEEVHLAAHIHDIGKIGIPDRILNKSGPLTLNEQLRVREHPVIGYHILAQSSHLQSIAQIVLYHHERWDGQGYPEGLKGEEIPLSSRIIAICDAMDAMLSDRPYRKALSWAQCQKELLEQAGKQFDPAMIARMEEKGFILFPAEEKLFVSHLPGCCWE